MTPERFPSRLAHLGFQEHVIRGVELILPPLCTVPAGPFLLGSDPTRDPFAATVQWTLFQQPQRTVTLPAYDLALYPVTVAEYACFVRAGQREPRNWPRQLGQLDHPVHALTWYDAVDYAAWLAEHSGELWQLPTEEEWEKGARGTDGRLYPWGDDYDPTRSNTSQPTIPVGMSASGASPYGVEDLMGHGFEWTSSSCAPYPFALTENRVLKGSSRGTVAGARVASRYIFSPPRFPTGGLRLMHTRPTT